MTFDIEFSGPFRGEGTGGAGAPMRGGHARGRDRWYVYYGMDLTAPGGTVLHALCDMVITKVNRPNTQNPDPHIYGADIFARSIPGQRVGLGFMHVDPASILVSPGDRVHRGDPIGRVLNTRAFTPHCHTAMAQRFPGDRKMGITSLYSMFLRIENSGSPVTVRFAEDEVTQPREVSAGAAPAAPPSGASPPAGGGTASGERHSGLFDLPVEEDHPEEALPAVCMPAINLESRRVLAAKRTPAGVGWLQRHVGNRAAAAALQSGTAGSALPRVVEGAPSPRGAADERAAGQNEWRAR